jgi:hypothetical protein
MAQHDTSSDVHPLPPSPLDHPRFHDERRDRTQAPTETLLDRIQRVAPHCIPKCTRSSLRGEHAGNEERRDHVRYQGTERESVDELGSGIDVGEEESEDGTWWGE